jgi:lipopolysaccharide export system protein LptA
MKASVERLRWGLAAAAVLLLLVLAGFLGYGRYKQVKKWRDTLRRLNLHGPHETTGFTYSSSPKDRTSYKVRAARVVQHGDGKWSMYDAAVTLYSKTSSDEDHIYGKDIEYDQNTGVATAIGEVDMDLQIPGSSAKGKASSLSLGSASDSKDDKTLIHVKTSGLVYTRKLNVAATDQAVEFRYAGMQCTSKGAEFDSSGGMLHLLADVVLTGTVKNAALIVHAAKADLNRQDNTITLLHPVAQSQGRTATAENAIAHMRKDGSVEQAEASGGVAFDEGTRHITAAAYSGTFSTTSQPVTGKLIGNVVITDSAVAKPMRGQANEVDATFDAAGAPASIVATGAAHVLLTEHKPGVPYLPREMRGDRIVATFVPTDQPSKGHKAQSRISEVHATGSAMARGVSIAAANDKSAAGLKSTQVSADDLRAVFDADTQKPEVRQVFGNGHTRLEQDALLGEKQTSSGDTLQIDFAKANATSQTGDQKAMQIAAATQSGHVVIHNIPATKPGASGPEDPSDATAARAVYDGAASKLTLTGGAHFSQGQTAMTAATVTVNQRTGDAEASGEVLATLTNATPAKNGATQSAAEPQITHVAADRATLLHVSQLSEFYGTDAHPARLWQGASQVQAATLLFDQKKKSLSARPAASTGMVHAVFANASQSEPRKSAAKDADQVVRVTSAAMDYDDIHREASFRGSVRMDGTTAQAQSQSATVFLNPAQPGAVSKTDNANPFGGSLRRIVLSENVRVAQPGRTGTGDQLVYTAADGLYVLTGAPGKLPHVVDAQQGSVTGGILSFHGGDSTIVVGGATAPDKPGRVRTETEVRGK